MPTSPTYYTPSQKEFLFAIESVAAGTAGTTVIREPCNDIVTTINRTTVEHMEYTGNAAVHVGSDETQHSATIVVTVPARNTGFASFAQLAMMGNASETVSTGSPPYSHTGTPSITTNRCNTFTIWHNHGDSANVLQMTYATITDISLTIDPAGVLVAAITLTSNFPTWGARPTINTYIGSTANYPKTRTLGSQGTYNLYNSANALYSNKILGATIALSRAVEVLPNAQGLDPADIATAEIQLAVTIQAEYDGIGAATIHRDYLNYTELGTTSFKHNIVFTNADGFSTTYTFWPARWGDGFTVDFSGTIVKLSGPLNSYHDLATVNAASPKQTMLESIVVKNALSALMTS